MAPTTRASSNTPTPVTTPTKNTNADAEDAGTPKSTPRKTPHCHTCGQPMRGHTRKGGCPTSSESPIAAKRAENGIEDSFQSLEIAEPAQEVSDDEDVAPVTPRKSTRKSPGRRSLEPRPVAEGFQFPFEKTKDAISERRRSERAAKESISHAESLDSVDSELASTRRLLNGRESPGLKNVHWHDGFVGSNGSFGTKQKVKAEPKERTAIMPCSLDPPSPWSSFASSGSQSRIVPVKVDDTALGQANTLGRTTSADARAMFLDDLQEKSTVRAQTSMVSDADLAQFQNQVPKGLFMKTFPAAKSPGQNVVIVGGNEGEVESLYQSLKKDEGAGRRRSSGFGVAAGGAVVGAAAAFVGLAYS
ncbi:hypothetical protein V5O48_001487 [Marasmius crinis-equi]|uniref:Uncharacterized protein n=1 Tax=Marasmius crinis-equi TaxID=585013 RepID=A0ABR3FYB8_9AGAR